MRETEIRFPSCDRNSELRALLWEPNTPAGANSVPRGVIQILHGMSEHIERYRDFAKFCVGHGFIVCGHDQIGHGKSVVHPERLGSLPPHGKHVLVEDTHLLRQLIQKRFASIDEAVHPETGNVTTLPHLLFGHSMGSFVLRVYLAKHAQDLSGAILCGTGHTPAALSLFGSVLARILSATSGVEHRSPLLHNLTIGAYSNAIENARTPMDWLSTDEAVVNDYLASDTCGFKFSAGGNIALMDLTGTMVKRKTIESVPSGLPLLFISGTEDPVGDMGKAVKKAVALFKEAGHEDVTLILYEGMRHEVLNEVGKEQVYEDILGWIEELHILHE